MRRSRGLGAGAVAGSALGALALGFMSIAAVAAVAGALGAGGAPAAQGQVSSGPSALAAADIPTEYLDLYEAAARRYGIDWAVLAGIGKVECDHGRDPDSSCRREGAVNEAGAGGPMQFLASTWAVYGIDGDGDGRADRWNPADAVYAAAGYLRASGAPRDYARAILAYNHASWYVTEVQAWARRYRSTVPIAPSQALPASRAAAPMQQQTTTPVRFVEGERATLDPRDGHVALLPEDAPATVQAMLVAGNELQDLPYGPQGHPDPRNATAEDCSSALSYVLYRSGVRRIEEIIAENPLAQDYVSWGDPGPGRWVTIYAADVPTPHVFVVIAGLRLDTSHDGTDSGPNRAEDGPRWRISGSIPSWARWSVRHPPGL